MLLSLRLYQSRNTRVSLNRLPALSESALDTTNNTRSCPTALNKLSDDRDNADGGYAKGLFCMEGRGDAEVEKGERTLVWSGKVEASDGCDGAVEF